MPSGVGGGTNAPDCTVDPIHDSPMVHQQQQWLKEFKAYAAKMGFSQILNGGLPAACLKYPEVPVPEEVDETDANFYRKNSRKFPRLGFGGRVLIRLRMG